MALTITQANRVNTLLRWLLDTDGPPVTSPDARTAAAELADAANRVLHAGLTGQDAHDAWDTSAPRPAHLPEPGYERIADALAAACDVAALDVEVYRDTDTARTDRLDDGWLTLARVFDKAGLIDWARVGQAA